MMNFPRRNSGTRQAKYVEQNLSVLRPWVKVVKCQVACTTTSVTPLVMVPAVSWTDVVVHATSNFDLDI